MYVYIYIGLMALSHLICCVIIGNMFFLWLYCSYILSTGSQKWMFSLLDYCMSYYSTLSYQLLLSCWHLQQQIHTGLQPTVTFTID